ncbi:HNH endonuclease [Actinopolymorpha alba]|uniref:HNH endonuclease n=1 Tax=Actinopolymorpha alba TaxID=533267 RepID=UPI00037A542D|nr:HNH endonuclease signature motif containing protein [Actinopolymorpha alba]
MSDGDGVRTSPLPPGFAEMLPGPGLAVAFAAVDQSACNGFELGELVRAARKLACWAEYLSLGAVNALAHCPPCFKDDEAERSSQPEPRAAELLAPLLGWTNYRADQFMLIALALTDLPNTRGALERGELEYAEVRTIVDRLSLLSPADRALVDAAIFPEVLKLRGGLLRLYIEAETIKINPEAAKERHKRARGDRGVAVYPDVDNVSTLRLHGISHDQAAQAWAYIDAIARTEKARGDERTLPQLRADIAVSILSGEADVIICDGPPEADGEENPSGEDCECEKGDGKKGDGKNGDDAGPCQGPFDDLLDEQDQANNPAEAEQDGCPHTGCDHEHHLEGCPCEDCKPATYTHPLDQPRRQARNDGATGEGAAALRGREPGSGRGEDGDREPIPEQEIPLAFRSWRAAVKAKLQLNVPITTLFELAERPAELGGFGPVLTEVARRLIANHLDNPDAMFAIGVTHPVTGQLLSLHPMAQRFLRGLPAEFVQSLNQRCTWMLCRRPAISCDLDHTKPYAQGGETSVENVAPLCRRHHRVKTEGDWKVEQTSPGHLTYTDPHSRQYQVTPLRLTDSVEPDDPDPPPF